MTQTPIPQTPPPLCHPRRCQKLKLKENATIFKLATVPHLPRIIVITRDRLLVLDAASAAAAEVATDAASGGAEGGAVVEGNGETGAADEGGDPAAAAASADGGEDGAATASTSGDATDGAAGDDAADDGAADGAADGAEGASAQGALSDMQAVVKSNHHLTELLKMTLLKKDPNVLTLHYRMGADMEQTKRRTYKLVTKEAFVAVRM